MRTSGGDSSLIARGEGQLGTLSALQRQISSANPSSLAMMRAAVAASVAASSMLAQQALAATGSAQSASGAQLAVASAAAREAVTSFERDMYERKIFDPYLQFVSKEDEEAYRKREAERKREIEEASAKNTPEGDLAAIRLSRAQMDDAKAHGADKSPDFQPLNDELADKEARLSQALGANKQQANQQVSTGSASVDPLDNIKPSATVSPDLIAKLKAAGVALNQSDQEGHGVPQRQALASSGPLLS